MKRKTYLIISAVVALIIFLAAVVGVAFLKASQYEQYKDTIVLLIGLLIIPLIGLGVFGFIANRCHDCGRNLLRIPFYAKNCPFCGKKLD